MLSGANTPRIHSAISLGHISRGGQISNRDAASVPFQLTQDKSIIMTEKPYVIFTLRRTGGTSLTGFLTKVSHFPSSQHEPLNKDRVWGYIAQDYAKTGDAATMEAALLNVLKPRPNIKHCIEICHPAITRSLITQTAALGYKTFVLTRRDEVGRQLSLALSKVTGAWGPEQAAKIYPLIISGEKQLPPLDLVKPLRQVNHDAVALGRTLTQLRNQQVPFEWLVFEELYKGDIPIETHARNIAAQLGITIAADDPRLNNFGERGAQGSRAIEPYVVGLAKLRKALAKQIFN